MVHLLSTKGAVLRDPTLLDYLHFMLLHTMLFYRETYILLYIYSMVLLTRYFQRFILKKCIQDDAIETNKTQYKTYF